MGKPRIVIADTEEMYLSSLEIKFLEELDDKIELETISDPGYFNSHFASPQSAEILIVSEDLYFRDLQKHNIPNIFVLTESIDDSGTEDLDIKKIFKYSNPNEIYNQVVATSNGVIRTGIDTSKETSVVLFYSNAGGVGKTTLAMGVSLCIAKNYKKVLYINAHRINAFQSYLNNTAFAPGNIYTELMNADSNIFNNIKYVVRNEGFDYIPPFGASLSSLNIGFDIYEKIIKSAKATKQYDVIIVDADTAFDTDKASLITMSDKVFIITTQSKASVNAVNMLVKNMNCTDPEKYFFVCNDFIENKYNALTGEAAKPAFKVNEYVKHIEDIDRAKLDSISGDTGIQKLSFLII